MQGSGKSHVMIGVKIQNTRHVNSQTGLAVNEKQQIDLKSVKRPEKQVRHNSPFYSCELGCQAFEQE